MLRGLVGMTLVAAAWSAFAGEAQRVTVSVEGGNDDYTPTGISIKSGDLVLIGASGVVVTGAWSGRTDPHGHLGRCGGTDSDGALVFKVGSTAPQKAGKHKLVIAEAQGELKLKVRDTKYSDNSGAFAVDVIRIPQDAVPPQSAKVAVDVANDEWTPSDLKVDVGDLLIVAAQVDAGQPVRFVNADPRSPGTPEGVRCAGQVAVSSQNDGALMVKIGTSEYRRAGSVNFLLADAAGGVKFRARLEKPAGNRGTYNVMVFKFPRGTIPITDSLAAGE